MTYKTIGLATTSNGKIYRSIDGHCNTWSLALQGYSGCRAICAWNDGRVLIGDDYGRIYTSTDYCETIDSVWNSGYTCKFRIIKYSPDYPNIVIAITFDNGYIFRSTDYGDTWSLVLTPPDSDTAGFMGLGIPVLGGGGFFMAVGSTSPRGYRSYDYGATWTPMTGLFPGIGTCYEVTVTGGGMCILATGTSGNVYKSVNYGDTWTLRDSPGAFATNDVVYLGSSSSVYMTGSDIGTLRRTQNNGDTWGNPGGGDGTCGVDIIVKIVPIANHSLGYILIASGYDGLLQRSEDSGYTYTNVLDTDAQYILDVITIYGDIDDGTPPGPPPIIPIIESMWLPFIDRLLPRSRAFNLHPDRHLKSFFRAIAYIPKEIHDYIGDVFSETIPSLTTMLSDWSNQFGGDTVFTANQLEAEFAAFGGQDPQYLQDEIQKICPNCYVHEWWVPASDPVEARSPMSFVDNVLILVNDINRMEPDWTHQFAPNVDAVDFAPNEDEIDFGAYDGYFHLLKQYPVPDVEAEYPCYFYVGGQTFPNAAVINESDFRALCRIIFKLKPVHLRCVLNVTFA